MKTEYSGKTTVEFSAAQLEKFEAAFGRFGQSAKLATQAVKEFGDAAWKCRQAKPRPWYQRGRW